MTLVVLSTTRRWSVCTRWRYCWLYLEDLQLLSVSTHQRSAAGQLAAAPAAVPTSRKLLSSPYVARLQSFVTGCMRVWFNKQALSRVKILL